MDVIATTSKFIESVEIKIEYTDNTSNTVILNQGDIITIKYLSNNTILEQTGMVKAFRHDESLGSTSFLDIGSGACVLLDCSTKYSSEVRTIFIPNIRDIIKINNTDTDTV